jgi:hypothetical protein
MYGERDPHTPIPVHRRLTEIEYVNWCFGQPYNMAVAVRLRGDVDADQVVTAIGRLRHRHPLLAVTIVVAADGTPWLDSAGVGPVPVRVIHDARPDEAARLLETEVATPFALDLAPLPPGAPAVERAPLLRACVLLSPRPSTETNASPSTEANVEAGTEANIETGTGAELVLCAQHVVADGLSMVFLVRDLLQLLREPDAPLAVLDAPARCERILPPAAARRVHRTPAAALVTRAVLRALHGVRSRMPRREPATDGAQGAQSWSAPLYSWQLTPEQTTALLGRCRAERVSVQSALCTAFLPHYTAINTPVSLRGRLAVDVGESVGLFVGNAVVLRSYRGGHDFWWNARAFHRRLRRAMRDPFLMIRMCSHAVPRPVVHEVMTRMMDLLGRRRPLAVTNLGVLDGTGLALDAGRGPRIESFHGAMSGFASASVLTVYTLEGAMRFHLRGRPFMTDDDVAREAQQATGLLLGALHAPANDSASGVSPTDVNSDG